MVRQLAELENWRTALRREDRKVALVPTMGALHEGHATLIQEAAAVSDAVIVSIFVNPLQFGPHEDFQKYPRDLEKDAAIASAAGATCIFAPATQDLTSAGQLISVDPGAMGDQLCGFYRPGHFRGVCTIVLKLLNLVQPNVAFFGWKDAQQLIILKKMVNDLNVPVELRGVETVREGSGLALSSRNQYLTPEERQHALGLSSTLNAIRKAFEDSGTFSRTELEAVANRDADSTPGLKIQYLEMVDLTNLQPLERAVRGSTLVAMAAFAGNTRLIDNVRL